MRKIFLLCASFSAVVCLGMALTEREQEACYEPSPEDDPNALQNQRKEANYTQGPSQWKMILVSSAETAALLTHMVAFSSQVPISLRAYPPVGGWKHVTFPDSLSASVAQLANKIWNTISRATGNMDEVKMWMKNIPANIRGSLRIVKKTPLTMIPKLLPVYLDEIENAGTHAADLASNTLAAFERTKDFLEELYHGLLSTSTGNEEKLRKARADAEVLKTQKQNVEKVKAMAEDRYKDLQGRVKQGLDDFHDQLGKVPDGWEKVGQTIVEGLGKAVTGMVEMMNPLNSIEKVSGMFGGGGSSEGKPTTTVSDQQAQGAVQQEVAVTTDKFIIADINNLLPQIQPLPETLTSQCQSRSSVMVNFKQMGASASTTMRTWARNRYAETEIKSKAVDYLTQLMNLCNSIATILEDELKSAAATSPCMQNEQRTTFLSQLQQIRKAMQTLSMVGAREFSEKEGSTGAASQQGGLRGLNDVQFAIAESRMILENLLEKEETSHAELMESLKQLGELNAQLKELDLREINLDKIIEILGKVGQKLSKLIEIWKKQLEFFRQVKANAVILKAIADQYARIGRTNMRIVETIGRQQMMESLLLQARIVNEKSYMVFTMAKVYVAVSREYLLAPLSKVNRMFTADSVSDVQNLRSELAGNVEQSKMAIEQLLRKEQVIFKEETAAQKQRYSNLLETCGGVPEGFRQIVEDAKKITPGKLSNEENEATEW